MSRFIKDLSFPEKQDLVPEALRHMFAAAVRELGDGAFWRYAATVAHAKDGAQMWVSKDVSADLQASDLRAGDIGEQDFSKIPWPHDRLEMVFEDAALPSFLFQRGSRDLLGADYAKWANMHPIQSRGRYDDKEGGQTLLIDVVAQTPDKLVAAVCLDWDDMNLFAAGKDYADELRSDGVIDLTDDETQELRELAVLAFKVLMFAASDGCKPRETMDPPTKRQGGKPGFKNRPRTKRLIVEYLPRQVTEKRKVIAEAKTGKTHQFLGRRGHWRLYQAARYTTMLGVSKFIYPVPGPDGTVPRRNFKVVKPK